MKRSRFSDEQISRVLKEQRRELQRSHLPKPPFSPRASTANVFAPACTLHLKPLPEEKSAFLGGWINGEAAEQT